MELYLAADTLSSPLLLPDEFSFGTLVTRYRFLINPSRQVEVVDDLGFF